MSKNIRSSSKKRRKTKQQLPKTLKTAVVSSICNTIINSSSPTQATRCSYQLTNGILGWLQLSSIIVGPLIAANVSRKWANVSYSFSPRKEKTQTFVLFQFISKSKTKWFDDLFIQKSPSRIWWNNAIIVCIFRYMWWHMWLPLSSMFLSSVVWNTVERRNV